MVLYARNDILSHHNPANGHNHARPRKSDETYVPIWGINCPPCEATLQGNPAWSGSRYKIPLTPDEQEEAEAAKAAAEAAVHQQQLLLARDALITQMAARNALPQTDPDDVAVTSGTDDAPSQSVEGPAGPDPDTIAADFEALTITDLKDLARDAGLPVSGKRADLVDRLVQHRLGGTP